MVKTTYDNPLDDLLELDSPSDCQKAMLAVAVLMDCEQMPAIPEMSKLVKADSLWRSIEQIARWHEFEMTKLRRELTGENS